MTDKPIVQHELAQRLAKMQHILFEDNSFTFMKAFWTTICREWAGIDRYRRDKFYALVRYFLHEEFQFLKTREWKSDFLRTHREIMINGPVSPSPFLPKGLLYHMATVYWDELNKVQNDWHLTVTDFSFVTLSFVLCFLFSILCFVSLQKLPVESKVILWEPFLHFLAYSTERTAIDKVLLEFFNEQLNRWKGLHFI
jgi:hypothetical protein